MLDWLTALDPHLFATRVAAGVFLLFVVPIGLFTSWSDLRAMRIPNRTVILLFLCFLVTGPFVLPLPDYLWRIVIALAVLAIGFVLNAIGGIGAGDVKFAAAAAPLIHPQDATLLIPLFASVLLGAFVTHRLFRLVPAVRRATPDWQSWSHRDFPMGLALSGTLAIYLGLALAFGQ